MKNLAFVLILLAVLFFPLNVMAQQAVSTATAPPGATTTPALSLLPFLTATFALSATPTETGSPTLTDTAIVSETATPGVITVSSMTPEPTLTSTQTGLVFVSPTSLATQTPEATLTSICPTNTSGTTDCLLSTPEIASLFSRVSLDSGLNPAIAGAALIDPSGQVIANASLNPDGTFTLTAATGNYILRLGAPGYLSVQKPVTLLAGQPIEIAATILLAGDINADNSIDALDLISLGAAYETTFPQLPAVDLNGDGQIDLFDLTLLARNWRKIGPITE